MRASTKKKFDELAIGLKAVDKLTAGEFFKAARATAWGSVLTSDDMVNGYNETLGRLFAQGRLTQDDVNQALRP